MTMTTGHLPYTAGLIFNGSRDLDIVNIGNRIRNAFEVLEQTVTGVRILSHHSACISSCHHDVQVTVREDQVIEGLAHPAALLLELAIADTGRTAADETPQQDTVLAHALKALHWTLSADHIKWVTPGSILSGADFVMATSQPVLPLTAQNQQISIGRNKTGIVERRQIVLPNIEETNDLIHKRMTQKDVLVDDEDNTGRLRAALFKDLDLTDENDPAQDDIREPTAPLRLSVWMVSFILVLFALPVGAALLVFNLIKGENLRLSAQVSALTGMFMSFQAFGTTAQAMTAINGIIG